MTRCNDALVWNNSFHFNSGLGVGLYRSSRNRVMHNRLDWNVRGYSHRFYQRGQDSAALLVYEQSSNNTFAFNSCTHSGDGFFLWAGQHTMDTGEGGCNDNLIFGNNFSHAPTNGIEVTFSRNRIQGNFITDCTYGIWGGYSYQLLILGNFISACRTGIAIEHGQNDTLRQNIFQHDSIGIRLWANPSQPSDWGYAQKRDTRSRDLMIDRNVFLKVKKPLHISASEGVAVNGLNLFHEYQTLLETPKPNPNLRFWRNDLYAPASSLAATWQHPELSAQRSLNFSHPDQAPPDPYASLQVPYGELHEPDSLPGGLNTMLPLGFPRSRQFIIINEWGPYDFRRPIAVLDTIATDKENRLLYSFVMLGPPGTWTLGKIRGVRGIHQTSGKFPDRLVLERNPNSPELYLEFTYVGEQPIATQFGGIVAAKEDFPFFYQLYEKKLDWQVKFYNYDERSDPLRQPDAFEALKMGPAAAEKNVQDLGFAWWGKPADGVQDDRFTSISTATFEVQAGTYVFELSSDDGARLYLDDKLLINN
ncbi:MAG TPA: right-handed parallel beta-helix repeat-containing protein, partial [Saprospiraceae bacterium]|nr:right-handed parallel beta-helix repeat-containing protein [Saprospiraceae bacterium]